MKNSENYLDGMNVGPDKHVLCGDFNHDHLKPQIKKALIV